MLARLSILEKRARQVFEHRPSELRVAVNGDVKGALAVHSDQNEIGLAVSGKEPIEFIEVFSEQQVRLLFLSSPASPRDPGAGIYQKVELSDGREMELTLTLVAQGAEIRLSYYDPTFREIKELAEFPDDSREAIQASAGDGRTAGKNEGFLGGSSLVPRLSGLALLFRGRRALAFAAVALMVFIGVVLFSEFRESATAKAVLEEAERKKLVWQYQPGKILYWEERERLRGSDEEYFSKRWSNNLGNHREWIVVRFDEEGEIVFGKWVKPDGRVLMYEPKNGTFTVYPGNSAIRDGLQGLSWERRETLRKYLENAERSVTSDQQAGIYTQWFTRLLSQSVENVRYENGHEVLRVKLKSDTASQDAVVSKTELVADYDRDSLRRYFYRMTFIRKDGTSTFEEARLISAREASLEEFEKNDLAGLFRSRKHRIVSIEEFADSLSKVYPPHTKR